MLGAGLVRQDPFKAGSLGTQAARRPWKSLDAPLEGSSRQLELGQSRGGNGYTPAFFVPLGSVERPRGQMLPTASPVGVLPAKEGS